jgi:hypothetical protein
VGRHRSDRAGAAKPLTIGAAVVLVLAVLVVAVRTLMPDGGSDASAAATPAAEAAASENPAERVPTVRLVCQAERCPVFVRIPGGDVLIDRDLSKGEEASYYEPELEIVLDDAGSVRVFENGTPREGGQPGEREAFKVKRDPDR